MSTDGLTASVHRAEPITAAALLLALRRRRRLVWVPALLLLGLAVASCFLARPRYRATAQVQVQKEDGGALGFENRVSGAGAPGVGGDTLDYTMTLQTEAGILRSPALAVAVLGSTGLERTEDYFGPSRSRHAFHLGRLLFWRKPLEPLSVPLRDAPNRRYVAEKIFASRLKVTPVAGTRLIAVSYLDPDPTRAAAVANAITATLANMAFEQRFAATLQGSSWLAGQLQELREQASSAAARAAELQRGTGLFGDQAAHNVVLERLDTLNQALAEAESNRILKESIDHVASTASPELISSLSGNSSTGSVASVNTSLSLLQGLRAQQADVRAQQAEAGERYGPAYPKVAELKARLADLDASVAAETTRLGQRAHTDWQVAVRAEDAARDAYEQQQRLAGQQNDSVIAYEMARQEADSSRDLYEGVLHKLKEASLLQGLRVNNVSVVSAAEVPPPNHPDSPNVPIRLAAGFAAGLLLGLCLAAWAELTDLSIHSLASLEAALGLRLLAVLPSCMAIAAHPEQLSERGSTLALSCGPARALPVLDSAPSAFAEGLRSLRTALQTGRAGVPPRVVMVTSALAREGRTTVAANLAALCARGGARVLLVDADMRSPGLHGYGETASSAGLAMSLSGSAEVLARPLPLLPQLSLLAGSELPPFPSELLGSARLPQLLDAWREQYDLVVFDTPPLLPFTDAALLAKHSDAVLVVARHRQTPLPALQRAMSILQRQTEGGASLGVVINDVGSASGEFSAYFGCEREGWLVSAS